MTVAYVNGVIPNAWSMTFIIRVCVNDIAHSRTAFRHISLMPASIRTSQLTGHLTNPIFGHYPIHVFGQLRVDLAWAPAAWSTERERTPVLEGDDVPKDVAAGLLLSWI